MLKLLNWLLLMVCKAYDDDFEQFEDESAPQTSAELLEVTFEFIHL